MEIKNEFNKEEFEKIIRSAVKCSIEQILTEFGLKNIYSSRDIHELRNLLEAWRAIKRTTLQTIIKIVVTGILTAILIGVSIKLKLIGGN